MTAVLRLLLPLLLLCSCTRVQYVPVESKAVRLNADSLQKLISVLAQSSLSSQQLHTVYMKESATFTLNEAGDTTKAVIERERDSSKEWHTKEAYYLAVIDSLSHVSAKVDSVYIEVPVPVEIVREVNRLKWWQKSLMWIGAVAMGAGVIIGAWKLKRIF